MCSLTQMPPRSIEHKGALAYLEHHQIKLLLGDQTLGRQPTFTLALRLATEIHEELVRDVRLTEWNQGVGLGERSPLPYFRSIFRPYNFMDFATFSNGGAARDSG